MSDTNQELNLLERVTASVSASDPALAGEELELREGWETLVQLTERASGERKFNERDFLARISASVVSPPSSARRGWLLVLGALAASLLVAALVSGYVASLNWANGNVARGVLPPREEPEQPSHIGQADGSSEVKWDDSLDEQIQYLRLTVQQLESGASTPDRSLEALGVQLEEFGYEIGSGSL